MNLSTVKNNKILFKMFAFFLTISCGMSFYIEEPLIEQVGELRFIKLKVN